MKKNLLNIFFLLMPIIFLSAQTKEEITFESEGLTLEGTLYLPEGEKPFAAAILVHGSGPIDRFQTIPLTDANSQCIYPNLFNKTITNFKDIAEHLQRNGIAVLLYDKRTFTFGEEELDEITISTKDFVIDIESAVDYLNTRAEVSTDHIFLIGHSQGSTLIPLATANRNIAGLISLAGPVTPPDTLVAEQFRNLFTICADDPSNGMIAANRFYREFQKIRNNELPDTALIAVRIPNNPNNPVSFSYLIFMRDWMEMADNVLQNYLEANLPTLIIQGDEDWNLPFEDAYRFQNTLTEDLTTVEIFEGVNHLLTTADDPKVSSAVLESITTWIQTEAMLPTMVLSEEISDQIRMFYDYGNLQIHLEDEMLDFNKIVITALDGRRLYRASLKLSGNNFLSIPLKLNKQIVCVSLLNPKSGYHQLISLN